MIKAGDKVSDRMILGELYTDDRNDRHTMFTGFHVVKCGKNLVQLVRFSEFSTTVTEASAPMLKSCLAYAGALDMGYRKFARYAPAA